jgi:ABC-type multidrug transport system ATPase subunit/ABC-type multidrug transport system permease subunit
VFSDLWYTINLGPSPESESNTVDLLKGVSGWALPGRMTALMGSSGAGKTTLLDVLADRKTTGTITGHILIDGQPPDRQTFRKIVGYVEQFGVHANQATVEESLLFSASLRLPRSQHHKAQTMVDDTLDLLELRNISGELTRDLSVEQNQRLTIAVELVANPSILFADEPTSGLDARAASIVMKSIQKVARSGRTVICTIHQPSIAVFSMFDDLLLMRRGGSVVFFGELGENSVHLIKYFEAVPSTKPCPVGYNPATWMLEVIGAGTSATADSTDFAVVYSKSKLWHNNKERLRYEFRAPETRDAPLSSTTAQPIDQGILQSAAQGGMNYEASASVDMQSMATPARQRLLMKRQATMAIKLKEKSEAPVAETTFCEQCGLLMKRANYTYWRSPEFSLSRILVILMVSVIISMCFWQQEYSTAAEIQSRISAISFIIMLAGALNLFQIMPFTIEKRALFYREIGSGMYSRMASNLTDIVVEIPYLIGETIIGVNIVYWCIGFQATADAFFFYTAVFFLYIFLMTSLGIFFAVLMPDALSAQLLASVAFQIFQLFAGVIVPYDKLPDYYKFLYYFSPQHYSTEALITTQFIDDHNLVCNPSGKIVTEAFIPLFNNKICSEDGLWPPGCHDPRSCAVGMVVTAEEYVLGATDPKTGEVTRHGFLNGYHFDNRYEDLLILFGWIMGLRILTSLTIYFVDHNKR